MESHIRVIKLEDEIDGSLIHELTRFDDDGTHIATINVYSDELEKLIEDLKG